MSWTLYAQILTLIFMVGLITMAAIESVVKAKYPKEAVKATKSTVYYSPEQPAVTPRHGDMWSSSSTGAWKVFNEKTNNWEDVKGAWS